VSRFEQLRFYGALGRRRTLCQTGTLLNPASWRLITVGCGKRLSVMLSGAKHLQCHPESAQTQIVRCAQDDSREGFSAAPALPKDTGNCIH